MKERSFIWSRVFLIGLVVSTAVLTVAGVLATYFVALLPDGWEATLTLICAAAFAGIAGFAMATSQMAAAMAQTLKGRAGQRVAFWMAVGCAVATGLISVGGVHLGAGVLGLDPLWLDIAGGALVIVKPSMAFITQACRDAVAADAAAAEAAEHALDRAASERSANADREVLLARLKQQPSGEGALPAPANDERPALPTPTRRARRPKRRNRTARAAAAGVIATASALGGAAAFAEAPPAIVRADATPPRPAGYTPTLDEVEQAREALARRNLAPTQQAIADHIGCTRKGVRRALGDPHA